MKRQIICRCLGVVAFLASVLLSARLDVQATPQKDNKEVSKLLENIKEQAAILQRDSDELEAYTRSNVSCSRMPRNWIELENVSTPSEKP